MSASEGSAILCEDLGKKYRIGRQSQRYRTLRDAISNAVRHPVRHLSGTVYLDGDAPDTIWALSEVSFSVSHGAVFGIIGPNGSGKSTLLKILAQITEPTAGRAEIRGRVGCVLGVGTGFHPELTGRENVFLSGIILGMTRREIKRKLDEIVAFAGVEPFMDTPVKHYSSGMTVRLGFAVAAHVEPDVLLIDEVLAVGDAAFQRQCLHRMHEIAESGRTVLFVSHNLQLIRALTQRVLWLEQGKVRMVGDTSAVCDAYESQDEEG